MIGHVADAVKNRQQSAMIRTFTLFFSPPFPTILEPRADLFRLAGILGVLWDRKKLTTSHPHSLQRLLSHLNQNVSLSSMP